MAEHVLDCPPEGAAADWTIPQDWAAYTAEDHETWDILFARQSKQLPGRAANAFLRGLDVLKLSKPGIPDFEELSERLMKATGWQVVAVPGLVPDDVFFDHLANRRFVAGNFIRRRDQLDYLQEPDVFHDVFGHVPMLADPVFADYMQAYGEGGRRSLGFGALDKLARLYWYTVEFGLVREEGGIKLFGSGIVSSHGESVFALDDPSPNRIRLRPRAGDAHALPDRRLSSRSISSSTASRICSNRRSGPISRRSMSGWPICRNWGLPIWCPRTRSSLTAHRPTRRRRLLLPDRRAARDRRRSLHLRVTPGLTRGPAL